MDVQLLRINFSFEKRKFHANFNIIQSFPEFSGKNGYRCCTIMPKVKKKILHSAEGGIYR